MYDRCESVCAGGHVLWVKCHIYISAWVEDNCYCISKTEIEVGCCSITDKLVYCQESLYLPQVDIRPMKQ